MTDFEIVQKFASAKSASAGTSLITYYLTPNTEI